jgi:hypothetical protein
MKYNIAMGDKSILKYKTTILNKIEFSIKYWVYEAI